MTADSKALTETFSALDAEFQRARNMPYFRRATPEQQQEIRERIAPIIENLESPQAFAAFGKAAAAEKEKARAQAAMAEQVLKQAEDTLAAAAERLREDCKNRPPEFGMLAEFHAHKDYEASLHRAARAFIDSGRAVARDTEEKAYCLGGVSLVKEMFLRASSRSAEPADAARMQRVAGVHTLFNTHVAGLERDINNNRNFFFHVQGRFDTVMVLLEHAEHVIDALRMATPSALRAINTSQHRKPLAS